MSRIDKPPVIGADGVYVELTEVLISDEYRDLMEMMRSDMPIAEGPVRGLIGYLNNLYFDSGHSGDPIEMYTNIKGHIVFVEANLISVDSDSEISRKLGELLKKVQDKLNNDIKTIEGVINDINRIILPES